MRQQVIGRDAEIEAVDHFLESFSAGAAALVVEGEPGIGKTTVWRAALEGATDSGFQVLSCRPAEAEAKLSYAAVADLLTSISDDAFAELPEPQRRALSVALLREEPEGPPPDQRAIATSLGSLLARLSTSAPVIVAIDDVQWLDRPSASALTFAARRLAVHPIGLLLAHRIEGATSSVPLGLDRALPRDRLLRVRLDGLSLGSLHHVIQQQLGDAPPRPTLLRIERTSAGNPFFALELARALDAGAPHPGRPLAVPGNLLALVRARLDVLPAPTREALLVVAALSAPTSAAVVDTVGDQARAGLEAAQAAGVIAEHAGRITFVHPLLGSAVYDAASPARRGDVHRRLAELVQDPEERARHLALGTTAPEADVAATLERAAEHANGRGAPDAARELQELSCTFTPEGGEELLATRRLALAEYMLRSGDTSGAEHLAELLVKTQPAGPTHARACELTARIYYIAGSARVAVDLCEQALAEARDDPLLLARIHTTFASVDYDDVDRSAQQAQAAVRILEELDDPDPALFSEALRAFAGAEHTLGRGLPMDVVERALELESRAPPVTVADRFSAALGAWLTLDDDFEGARRWLDETHRAALDEGDEGSLPYAISHFPRLELSTGDWKRAEETALEHLELAEQMGQAAQRTQALFNVALVRAHQGREAEARAAAEGGIRLAEADDDSWMVAVTLSVLGFLDLSLGDEASAARELARSVALYEEMGVRQPLRCMPDYVESLVAAGELERARAALDEFEPAAHAVGRISGLAAGARSRAVLVAASGDLDGALAAIEDALRHHQAVAIPIDVGRAQLVLGVIRRRRKEKRLAKEALEQALATFEELGAALWAERARSELARVGLRPAAGWELTETERRVAELAGNGHTNREVAQLLFMSPKTVEANLARVYRKLGIRSRAELGARMSELAQE